MDIHAIAEDIMDDIISKARPITWVDPGHVVAIQGIKKTNNTRRVTGVDFMSDAQPPPELAESDVSSDESDVEYIEEREGLRMTHVNYALPPCAILDRIDSFNRFFTWLYNTYSFDPNAQRVMRTICIGEAHDLASMYMREASMSYHSDASFQVIRENTLAIAQLTMWSQGKMPWEAVHASFTPPSGYHELNSRWVDLKIDEARDNIKMYKCSPDYLVWHMEYCDVLLRCAKFLMDHANWFGLSYMKCAGCLYIPSRVPSVKCWHRDSGVKRPSTIDFDPTCGMSTPANAPVFRPPMKSKLTKRSRSPEV